MIWMRTSLLIALGCLADGCAGARGKEVVSSNHANAPSAPGSFGDDLAFLAQHTKLIVLKSGDGRAQVAVAPAYQGRVMTSSAEGEAGVSFGYVHRAGVALERPTPHITVVGGEDRFWLGPEGGPYALYFAPGAPFTFESWQVPKEIDWDTWPVTSQSERALCFERAMELTNYHGSKLRLNVVRTVSLLSHDEIESALGQAVPRGVAAVAYASDNRVSNAGSEPLRRETGLFSIWILGMFPPGQRATVALPYKPDGAGPIVRDDYFGRIPAERLRVGESALFFRADGQERGKLGISFARAKPIAGSYDPDRRVLTIVQYTLPEGPAEYVNSTWNLVDPPYAGDVVNSYNDGPNQPGAAPLGPFYEIESSSPARELAPGEAITHVSRTFHFTGEASALDVLAQEQLGVTLAEIAGAFAGP